MQLGLCLSYLKLTRAFPAPKKARGLTVVCWPIRVLAPSRLWPRLPPPCSLSFRSAVLLVPLQVKSNRPLPSGLLGTVRVPFSQIHPHFIQATLQSLLLPRLRLISTYLHPPTYMFLLIVSSLGWRRGLLSEGVRCCICHPGFPGIFAG